METTTSQCTSCGRTVAERLTICPARHHERLGNQRVPRSRSGDDDTPLFARYARQDSSPWGLLLLFLLVGVVGVTVVSTSDVHLSVAVAGGLIELGATMWLAACVGIGLETFGRG